MKLRQAGPSDAPSLAALAARAYAGWTRIIGLPPLPIVADYAAMTSAGNGKWECWILDGPDGAEASLCLELAPEGCELYSIAVDPAAQGTGLGRKLMLFAERRARERGYREIALFTNIKMVANRALYRRLGYEETGRVRNAGREAVTMSKRLDGTTMTPPTEARYADRRAAYRKLHEAGCFLQPNPWDVGSARWLRALGFPALATTSAGFAWSKGLADQDVSLDLMLGYIAEMVEAVPDLPVNADFENGYAAGEEALARNVKLCVETGVAGLSIEDATGDPANPLYDFDTALSRFKAAKKAVDETKTGVMLTARAEAYLHGHPDPLADVCKRLAAFADAGADVLYAPGPKTKTDMREVIAAAGGKPVNIIVFADVGLTHDEIAELGARRISIGSALAKAAWTGFVEAAEQLKSGSFAGFAGNMPSATLNGFFLKDRQVGKLG